MRILPSQRTPACAYPGKSERDRARNPDFSPPYHHGLGPSAVEIQSVEAASPASRAGLKEGDLLVRFATTAITSVEELHRALRTWPADQPATLGVIRRGTRIAVDLTPVWAS